MYMQIEKNAMKAINRELWCTINKETYYIWPSNSTPGYISNKRTKTPIWKDACTLNVHSSIIYNSQDTESIQVSINRWRDKEDVPKYDRIYSARKKEILLFEATRMDVEGIMLRKVSQRKTNTVWYNLYVESKIYNKLVNIMKKAALIDIESKLVVTTRKGVEGQHGFGEWEVQITGCKID